MGCSNISLITELSDILGVDTRKLLDGDMTPNGCVAGNMKNTRYYVVAICNNISLCTGNAELSCGGNNLTAQVMKKAGKNEKLSVQVIEEDWYITSAKTKTKRYYISFVAFATVDSINLSKQYLEWESKCAYPQKRICSVDSVLYRTRFIISIS